MEPGFEKFARTATRLRPEPGEVTATDSHIGGPLLWPADEPWPTCDEPHMTPEEVPLPAELGRRLREAEARREQPHVMADGEVELNQEVAALVGPGFSGWGWRDGGLYGHRYGSTGHPWPNPMIPVAQLRAEDIPDLPRPGGADLLQVLWCPFDHEDYEWGPRPVLVWRRETDVTDVLAEPPKGEAGEDAEYVPEPCQVRPEQVTEYPWHEELPPELRATVTDWGAYTDEAITKGWKVGGYASWNTTDLLPTPCPVCGGPTDLLLTIDSDDWDTTEVVVGRSGKLRFFVCLRCPGSPFRLDLQ